MRYNLSNSIQIIENFKQELFSWLKNTHTYTQCLGIEIANKKFVDIEVIAWLKGTKLNVYESV